MSQIDPKRFLESEKKHIMLKEDYKDMLILDIGGGGEGVIGSLYGRNVIAIDRRLEELNETNNDSIKVIMDACDLKFTNNQFDVATLFYTLMYMKEEEKIECISEVKRVLKPGGIFEIWDTYIPSYDGGEKDIFVLRLEIDLPQKAIDTGYAVMMKEKEQKMSCIKDILIENGFKIKECNQYDNGLFNIKCEM
ncbi:class I SAM-dependent methyltransferase [Vallitalea pronyensis]|uniref:Class I SAM-dependent methyltransferase n=1 Tax=Vallitalea pronyensis TaxID=1348613 RepID=A0A8J8MMZ9_9FIRM|nr:class I SAM-dependent methyltransferase [Vallitalea pronyensis]QUI24660.1 class I SAM-dependent methyltransferase [Vallitalea pronyensis]